ncbi:hypothetical protein GOP47_0017075 [Adiantum capillus-veneris]|uniref:phospholipase D n=1 Tax=Adiantum capillus-veneris TaxID=13818 RepID=A0A9D4UJ03_ADICA|nr:hypothetical protein GOP47_0017075 [Adiantum capillus-veneris]
MHHQKLVIVDAQGPGNTRRLVAFIGGLDLCDGRFDTPEHPLFKDLSTTFADDFHSPTFSKADSSGPRQPWHDLHCKIERAAAYDVYRNFEQSWWKAAKWHRISMMCRKGLCWSDDVFVDLDRVPWIVSPSKDDPDGKGVSVMSEHDPETWHTQDVFFLVSTCCNTLHKVPLLYLLLALTLRTPAPPLSHQPPQPPTPLSAQPLCSSSAILKPSHKSCKPGAA